MLWGKHPVKLKGYSYMKKERLGEPLLFLLAFKRCLLHHFENLSHILGDLLPHFENLSHILGDLLHHFENLSHILGDLLHHFENLAHILGDLQHHFENE